MAQEWSQVSPDNVLKWPLLSTKKGGLWIVCYHFEEQSYSWLWYFSYMQHGKVCELFGIIGINHFCLYLNILYYYWERSWNDLCITIKLKLQTAQSVLSSHVLMYTKYSSVVHKRQLDSLLLMLFKLTTFLRFTL